MARIRAAGICGWRRGVRLPLPRQNEEGRVQNSTGSRKDSEQRKRSAHRRQGRLRHDREAGCHTRVASSGCFSRNHTSTWACSSRT